MANAYMYAMEDGISPEVRLGKAVDRFGGMAVYGRTISEREMRYIRLAEGVVGAIEMRAGHDWDVWGIENPEMNDLIGLSLRAAIDLGLIHAD